MDEIWEKAVETALEGEKDHASAKTLTLDGAVKCVQGRLPPPSLLERFQNLQHLSIANVGVSSLEQFPRLRSLQKLNLSDNRIAGGLEFLVQAGLDSLRDLDLSNNRIQFIEDLAPLAQVKLVSLDLYECPVTRVKDYRSRVFGLIKSLKYLDKMDAEENERPESDDEEEDDEEEEEEEEDDPGSGEIDGGEEDQHFGMNNGHGEGLDVDGVVDADEDEESDADEEVTETSRGGVNGVNLNHQENGFHVAPVDVEEEDDDEDSGEEIDEEEGDDDDVVEVHEIDDSDDDEDGVEYDEDDDDDEDDEVDNDEGDFAEPESTSGRLVSTEGEIDGHEQGEEDGDEDDNGETGEDEMAVEEDDDDDDDDDEEFEDDDEEEDFGAGYLVQPVGQAEALNDGVVDTDEVENEDGEEEEEVDDDDEDNDVQEVLPPASSHPKRKRDNDDDDDDEDDEDEEGFTKPSKKHH
ncbi:acidic leucine-rich nuclear phosphoprotein 32-related protein [Trifolium repens]|nr:acidic leucine-rich nuclear phosphoprotein 32-related protein [Trifolium repens]